MAAAANIAIYDGQPTPVLRTFVPARKTADVVFWEERDVAATPLGFARIGIGRTTPKGTSPVIRTRCTLVWPFEVLDANTGLYSYKDVARMNAEFIMPISAVEQSRDDAFTVAKNIIAAQVLYDTIVGNNPAY
jgi:hypothetical protein